MCSVPDGYGQHLELVPVRLVGGARLGVRHVEGPRVLPDALPLLFDRVCVVSVHRDEKASPERGRGELPRRRRVCLPDLAKQPFIGTLILATCARAFPRFRTRRRGRALARRRRRDAARRGARHAAPRLLRGDDPGAGARVRATPRPGALVVYGTKAFANVALLRVLAEEGVGADVSTLGELAFAQAAGIPGERILFHGNNKSDEELRAAAAAGVDRRARRARRAAARGGRRRAARPRAADAGRRRGHARVDPHGARRARSSASPPRRRCDAIDEARTLGLDVAGVHFHVGSQLARVDESMLAVERLAAFCERARAELGWTPGGARHRRRPRHPLHARRAGARRSREFVGPLVARLRERWPDRGAARARAGPLARRPRRRDALPRRRREGERRRHATSRSTAACPTTRGRSSTARATRRCSRTAPTSSPTASSASPASTASRATC